MCVYSPSLTGYGLCFLYMAATPVIRAKLSKLVGPEEQVERELSNEGP